jgi:hypothetical protein
MSRIKKILIGVPVAAAMVAILIAAISQISGAKIRVTLPAPTTPTLAAPPVQNPKPATPSPIAPNHEPGTPASGQNRTENDALNAAVADVVNLTSAMLLPMEQMRSQIDRTVVPSQRRIDVLYWVYTGANLTAALQYKSVPEAYNSSGYYLRVIMWHPVSFNGRVAVFGLYGDGHGVNALGQAIDNYQIEFVKMKWMNGEWLYAGSVDPPADQTPPPGLQGQSSDADQQQFGPYLEKWGWKVYVSAP